MPLTHIPVSPLSLDRYRAVLDEEQWADVERTRARSRSLLAGHVVWNVNSTAAGGGVAEMLRPLLAYARGAGIDARWAVIGGNPDFFRLTKRLHNRLHGYPGDGGSLDVGAHELYRASLAGAGSALRHLARPGDIVILHDPQTAGLIPLLDDDVHVVWRSHIGRDTPNASSEEGWRFLAPYIAGADEWIFSRPDYAPAGLDPERITIVRPSIDVFSPKNQELDVATVDAILSTTGLQAPGPTVAAPVFSRFDGTPGRVDRAVDLGGDPPPPRDARIVTQVSRWDHLKDPLGVLQGFVEQVAPGTDAHLILAGPATAAVSDDPEGAAVLQAVRRARLALEPALRSRVHLACLPMDDPEENAVIVNALQRRSVIVVQKSLAEGFGLTVGEAMWKRRAVVASAVGGIRDQIQDGVDGVLLQNPTDLGEFGAAVRGLLDDPELATAMGMAAHERVRDRFMSVRHLIQYGQTLERLHHGAAVDASPVLLRRRPAGHTG